ncbi:MAG: hypothetical protein J6Y03_02710 [Alphaproteobacteria bacterium]|nr:hypothetical protein [Alphaproteobacteria bacterium]
MNNIKILTPYKLFFITQGEILYALMKDGRTLKIKQTPYFSNISSDKKILSGISFDGENTHILSIPFGFDLAKPQEITSLFGYFYYPCLSKDGRKMAVVEADLLKPRPQGELRLYKRKIKHWYQQVSFESRMKAPFISSLDDSLFFIDEENRLVHYIPEISEKKILANDIQNFSLSSSLTKIVYFTETQVYVYSLLEHKEITNFPMTNLTAVCFDASEKEILYARNQDNRFAIYSFDYQEKKTTLLLQTNDPVVLLSV